VVARIGFGAMQLERRDVNRDTALAVLRQAVGAGVNHIDTAQFYDDCNALVRAALAPYPDDLVLVSKVGAERDASGGLVPAQRPEQLRAQVEANLATLGVERLDVVNLRRLDAAPGIVAEGDQLVDLDDQLAELAALRDAGKIGGVGLSSVCAEQLDQAAPIGIACVQNLYNIANRGDDALIDKLSGLGIAYAPFFPLGGFAPLQSAALSDVAARLGATAMQTALAWLLHRAPNMLLIPGTSSLVHLRENLAAAEITLSDRALAELDAIGAEVVH